MGDSLNENLEKKMREMQTRGGREDWFNKQHVIFTLEVMYGSLFNREQASMLYDKIRKESE